MQVSPPLWLNPPEVKILRCKVVKELPPQGYLVEVSVDGQERSIVVPASAVRLDGDKLPTSGALLVVVVADLSDDKERVLTELPATPISGSQRMKVERKALEAVA